MSHKLGWPESEIDIKLARCAGSPLSVTASQPISSAIRSGSTPGSLSSYRDVEAMLAECGLDVSYETVRRWFLKFGPVAAANLRRPRPRPGEHWHRDAKAARKLMKKLLKTRGFAPARIVTDKLRLYPSAFRAMDLAAEHDRDLRASDRAREFASTGSPARGQTTRVHLTRFRATLPLHPLP